MLVGLCIALTESAQKCGKNSPKGMMEILSLIQTIQKPQARIHHGLLLMLTCLVGGFWALFYSKAKMRR